MSAAHKVLLAASAAMLLLASTAGTAAALRSFSFSRREISLLSRALTFLETVTIICEVDFDITLNSITPAKVTNTVLGRVTAIVLRCSQGTARVLNTPWNIKFESYFGTLPNISGIVIEVEKLQIQVTNVLVCLIRAEISGLQRVTPETGVLKNLSERPFTLKNVLTGGACEEREVTMLGTFEPVNGPIAVTLI